DRGYVTIEYDPQPVTARAFLRSLELGRTPVRQKNIRAGYADIRLVPVERGYQSWRRDVYLVPGQEYRFAPVLELNHAVIPLPDDTLDE
ncbi:MAG TPA: PEGA domain-containing protein, partial [bacterium]|nr:PEGA domain-containing protein [bacterium]